ncbi:MAG TPA: hypothetical protein VK463_00515 [Desulfomonilaceae bacterium]|nr:hypothetical protein [Desulfomonilaceae bacterium]
MRHVRLCILLFILFVLVPHFGAACADEVDILADRALKVSGITGQLDDLGAAVIAAVPADAFPNVKARHDASAHVKKTMNKNALLESVRSVVRADADRQVLEGIVSFYESKLGRRVGRLQESALEPNLLRNIREGRKVMAETDEARLATLRRIVDSDRAHENNKALLNTVVKGLVDGHKGDTPDTMNEGEIAQGKLKIMDRAIRSHEDRNKELAVASYAYTYKSLDDKELAELAAFRESRTAARFGEAVQKGLNAAVYKIARSFAESAARWRTAPVSGDSESKMEQSPVSGNTGDRFSR